MKTSFYPLFFIFYLFIAIRINEISAQEVEVSPGIKTLSLIHDFNTTGTDTSIVINNTITGSKASTSHTMGVFNKFNINASAQYGLYNILGTAGFSPKHGVYSKFGSNTGAQFGVLNDFAVNSSTYLQHGVYNNFFVGGISDITALYNNLSGTNSGDIVGLENFKINSGSGVHTGVKNTFSGSGSGLQYGILNEINVAGNSTHYGVYNDLKGSGSGVHYATYNNITGTGSGLQYGNYTSISNTGNATHYATMNELSGNSAGTQYGTYTDINTPMASQYGNYNNLSAGLNNNVTITGILNNLEHHGSGVARGAYNFINHFGTGESIASHNYINTFSTAKQVANKNEINSELSSTGIHIASENIVTAEAGENYGTWNQIEGTSNVTQIGSKQNILSSGNGLQYGIQSSIINNGNGEHCGTGNYLTGTGSGPHYGTFNSINSTGSGDKYGVYNLVFGSSTMSKNVAGYFSAVGGSEAFAAIFSEGKIVMNDVNSNSDVQVKSVSYDNMLRVDADQNKIGIRTALPSDVLHINSSNTEDALRVEVGGATKFRIFANGGVSFGALNPGVSSDDVYFDNQVGFGVASPTYRIELENNTANGQGRGRAFAWDTYSDKRVKTNIHSLSYGLNDLLKMNPVGYDHHASTFENEKLIVKDESSKAIGFIAQEMYNIIPEVVSKPKDENTDLWSMDYEKLIPVLVNAIKEQQQQIDAQNELIKSQNVKLKALDDKLAKLEKY